jgi:hypothetical protein
VGLFDTVKAKAGELAADAERAGKVAAAQTRLVTLQNDVKRAERELGQATYALIAQGGLSHPGLEGQAIALDDAYEALHAKEQEITSLRGQDQAGSAGGDTSFTYRAADVPAAAAATGPQAEHGGGPDAGGAPAPDATGTVEPSAEAAASAAPGPSSGHTAHTPAEEVR